MLARSLYGLLFVLVAVGWLSPAPKLQERKELSKIRQTQPVMEVFKALDTGEHLLRQATRGGKCNLEIPKAAGNESSSVVVTRGESITWTGWSMNSAGTSYPGQVMVRFTDAAGNMLFAFPRIDQPRQDVRQFFDLPKNMTNTGYVVHLNFLDVPKATYFVDLVLKLGKENVACGETLEVTVQ